LEGSKIILGHHEIKKRLENDLVVKPLDADQIRENGLDLSIDSDLTIEPNRFALAKTREWIEFPTDLIGFCNLRSPYARKGLFIPPTVVDCGFKGKLVIEVVNFSLNRLQLKKGERFLHMIIAECKGGIEYKGRYQYQR